MTTTSVNTNTFLVPVQRTDQIQVRDDEVQKLLRVWIRKDGDMDYKRTTVMERSWLIPEGFK